MITNSKPERRNVCRSCEQGIHPEEAHVNRYGKCDCTICGQLLPSLQADKHKRVAERLWEYRFKPGANKLEFERILREEYPE